MRSRWQPLLIEYRRPWKLVTFAIGLALLLVGVTLTPAPDWDVPVCFIMAIPTRSG
ncbi:hypothetical protein SAMN02745857_00193 [Andreprevotia lacus DSM 23236]|jgi:hypothetical protein|uniref:Uncharacterized protein n=1 Tax=Andreprevotia lacus DSM 23236 TaxID=1121001 RepID=A0A1W1WZ89_9NEIS|nr:hypothetical protein [Andreprevotia lacus]SMC16451.1 hypothetical protein SAMN02745857_00193 [Andreprevotia lacus DSM 23236]